MNTKISIASLTLLVAFSVLADSSQAQVYQGSATRQQYAPQYTQGQVVQGSATQSAPTQYYNVTLNDEQKAKSSIGAVFYDTQAGAAVRTVYTNSPAQMAGLNSGEVITKINGKPVQGGAWLTTMIEGMAEGDAFSMTKRSVVGKEMKVDCRVTTMGKVLEGSIVPEAGVYDQAVIRAQTMMKEMEVNIRNAEAELADSKKRYAAMQQRVEDLKAKAEMERKKEAAMKAASGAKGSDAKASDSK